MLGSDQIDAMRAKTEETMTEECVINHAVKTQLENGQWVKGAPTETDSICRIGTVGLNAKESEIAGRMTSSMAFVLSLPYDVVLVADDEIEVGSRRFVVRGVLRSTFGMATRVLCEELS